MSSLQNFQVITNESVEVLIQLYNYALLTQCCYAYISVAERSYELVDTALEGHECFLDLGVCLLEHSVLLLLGVFQDAVNMVG